MDETPSSESISTKLERIAQLARQAPTLAFTTLAHHIDVEILRLIGKWLNAGVMEAGALHRSESGTPQGGVMLANILLHEVLDVWFHQEVLPRLGGRALLVRYADDAVMLFEREEDARRVMDVLPKRFSKYGLTLHPDKTRLVPFKRPDRAPQRRDDDDGNGPGSFDFLGFTIHWGKSLAGKWVVKERTAKDRFRRALVSVSEWCKRNMHAPLGQQQQALNAKLRGHYGYYGRVGNRAQLWTFLRRVVREWKRRLGRRSQRPLYWKRMYQILERFPLLTPAQARPA